MKKTITLIALAFASLPLLGQFSMSASDLPQVGNSQYYTVCDTNGVDAGSAGTGQTWSYTALTPTGNTTVTYGLPNSHPSGSNFPSATMVQFTPAMYKFYAGNADSVVLEGERSIANTAVIYAEKPTLYVFPMTFGYLKSDSAKGTYPDGFISSVDRKGMYTVEFDGSGTLTTPYMTYNNVNRIKTVGVFRDSSWTGAAESDVVTLRYEWYQQGTTTPQMVINYTEVTINGGAPQRGKDVWYADNGVGVNDPAATLSLTVSPNPASEFANVMYALPTAEAVRIEVLNTVGQVVRVAHEGMEAQGFNTHVMPLEGLSAGMYFVRVKAGELVQIEKFMVR